MYVNEGGIQGFVPHQVFNGKQVSPVFVQMCTKGMAERMAGQAALPAKLRPMLFHPTHDIKCTAGF